LLPPIEPDETLVAYGRYQQLRQERPTPIQEHWTVHTLPDGALIWRSQLSHGTTPLSACYLLRDPQSRPVQLIFFWRWADGREDVAEYRFMPGYVTTFYHEQTQEMLLPARYEVYSWHTITENFVWMGYDQAARGAQHFNLVSPNIQDDTLWPGVIPLEAHLEQIQIAPGNDGPRKVAVFALQQPGVGLQYLHVDEFGVPLKWALPAEHLSAVIAEYTRTG
jgi:hypothetical protein